MERLIKEYIFLMIYEKSITKDDLIIIEYKQKKRNIHVKYNLNNETAIIKINIWNMIAFLNSKIDFNNF